MSPEQLRGEVSAVRSDIYSMGVILYEMATGRRPFEAALTTTLVDATLHITAVPPGRLRPDLSPRLEQIIVKCLEKEPGHRYQSALELLTDLRRASRAAAQEKSVAVLYFENLSGQKEDEYFRDGITEDITTELSKIKAPRVFSRSAVLAFRDKPVTPAQVGPAVEHSLPAGRQPSPRCRSAAHHRETRGDP
jgi:non-specific serine/threonine protein kinase